MTDCLQGAFSSGGGGNGGNGAWSNLGSTTLESAGDTISIASLADKDYLHVEGVALSDSGTPQAAIRLNDDSSSNYSSRYSINHGSDVTGVNADMMKIGDGASVMIFFNIDIMNNASNEKLMYSESSFFNSAGAGAGVAPTSMSVIGKWVNTADVIDRVDIINIDTGDFAIGSSATVFGTDA